MALATTSLRPLIDGVAFTTNLPWWRSWSPATWLEALILQESGGDSRAMRYERHQDISSLNDPDAPTTDDGLMEDDKSYGLMQVMGYNIRNIIRCPPNVKLHYGFALRPVMGLALGLRILLQELDATNGVVSKALARYNGGPTGELEVSPGKMRRQVYVDGVAAWAEKVARDRTAIR